MAEIGNIAALTLRADNQLSAAVDDATRSLNRMQKAAEGAEAAVVSEEEKVRRAGRTHDAVARSIDGAAAAAARVERAERRHAEAVEAVTRALAAGQITTEAAARQIDRLGAVRERDIALAKEHGAKIEASFNQQAVGAARLTASTGYLTHAMRSMGLQSIDVFQQLATGAPVMMTLVQQGGQVAQMAAYAGIGLGQMVRGVGSFIAQRAGIIATGAAIAGLGVSVYTLVSRASEIERTQRNLSTSIASVGRSAELSVAQLQSYTAALKSQGIAEADAAKLVGTLARDINIPSDAIGRIAALIPDVAAAGRMSPAEALNLMAEAARGTTDEVRKLADTFGLLTPAQDAAIAAMIAGGDKARALETVFALLQERIGGMARRDMSDLDRALRDAGNAWSDFVTRIASSAPALAIMRGFAETFRSVNIGDMTAKMAELQGEIAGYERRLADPRIQQRGSTAFRADIERNLASAREEMARVEARVAKMTKKAEVPTGDFGQSQGAGLALARSAESAVEATQAGRIAKLRAQSEQYREALTKLDPAVAGNARLMDVYTKAIAANEDAIAGTNKETSTARSGLEKAEDTISAQIRAHEELARAHGVSAEAVREVTARLDAEKRAITEGIEPGSARYAETVKRLTGDLIRLRDVDGASRAAGRVAEANDLTAAQERMLAAYDGTTQSVARQDATERAMADARKAGLIPGTEKYTAAVARMGEAYYRGTEATNAFQHAQRSVTTLLDSIGSAADRIGQSLVDMFIGGGRAAVSFGSIARAAFASIATDVAKLAIVNPIVNSILGGNSRPTLGAALGAISGGSGATSGGGLSGLLSGAGNVLSLGRITDLFGLTNFGGQLSGLGNTLGLTGNGGILSGLGGGISDLLGTSLWGATSGIEIASAANVAAGIGPAGLLSESAVAGSAGLSGSVGSAGLTFGSYLGGLGLGFGAGSFAGGLTQRAFNKVGPGPTIGAGIGAAIGSIFGPIGGLAGGLIGGVAGSLIGPRPATPFSATGLTSGADGMLGVGRTFSQLVNTDAEVAALSEQVARVNAILSAGGARIANAMSADEYGQSRIVGGTSGTWLNFGQGGGRPGDLGAAFGELRFGSQNADINAAIQNRAFASLDDFAAVVDRVAKAGPFLADIVPALTDLTEKSTAFSDALKAVNDNYEQAITFARETLATGNLSASMADNLRKAETDLIAAREQAALKAIDAAIATVAVPVGDIPAQIRDISKAFDGALGDIRRSVGASTAVTVKLTEAENVLIAARERQITQVMEQAGRQTFDYNASLVVRRANVTMPEDVARLFAFDEGARLERQALDQSLVQLWGEAIRQTSAYADQFGLLNDTLSAERAALVRQFTEATAAVTAARRSEGEQSALGLVVSLRDYARGLAFGPQSALSPQQQYAEALSQFNAVSGAARAGDFGSAGRLTQASDSLLTTARELYGSGTGYAEAFERVREVLEAVANRGTETLVADAIRESERTQTTALSNLLLRLTEEVRALRLEVQHQSGAPARATA